MRPSRLLSLIILGCAGAGDTQFKQGDGGDDQKQDDRNSRAVRHPEGHESLLIHEKRQNFGGAVGSSTGHRIDETEGSKRPDENQDEIDNGCLTQQGDGNAPKRASRPAPSILAAS